MLRSASTFSILVRERGPADNPPRLNMFRSFLLAFLASSSSIGASSFHVRSSVRTTPLVVVVVTVTVMYFNFHIHFSWFVFSSIIMRSRSKLGKPLVLLALPMIVYVTRHVVIVKPFGNVVLTQP